MDFTGNQGAFDIGMASKAINAHTCTHLPDVPLKQGLLQRDGTPVVLVADLLISRTLDLIAWSSREIFCWTCWGRPLCAPWWTVAASNAAKYDGIPWYAPFFVNIYCSDDFG